MEFDYEGTTISRPNMTRALELVVVEREKQEIYKIQGRFTFTLADDMPEPYKLACISEEVGEVAANLLKRNELTYDIKGQSADHDLIRELTQIAALAVAWIESLI